MKRMLCLILAILCVTAMFTGCQKEPPDAQTTAPEMDTTAPPTLADLDIDPSKNTKPPETESEVTEPPVPSYPTDANGLPEYVPGTLKLQNQESDDFEFERKYRIIYYEIFQGCWKILTDEQSKDFWEWTKKDSENTNYGENREEMRLVSMIKRYNIPREVMEGVIEKKSI